MAKKDITEQVKELYAESMPQHVGIIMDGNGRWAQSKKMPRAYGHKKGVDSVRNAVRFARAVGVKSLTLFAFSSENWKRPEEEVSGLMDLFMFVLSKEIKALHKNNIKLNVIGHLDGFSTAIQNKIQSAHELTGNNDGLTLNIAANYGGRWDIVQASQKIAELVKAGELESGDITEDLFNQHIYCAEQAPLDLMIRTGGETRISNFLLWQAAYAELYFTDVYWPEFDQVEFANAISSFAGTERRFGLTGEQVKA